MSRFVCRMTFLIFTFVCISAPTRAQEAIRIILSRSLTYNIFQRTLPIPFATSYGNGYVVDLIFCGQDTGASGKVLMIAGNSLPVLPHAAVGAAPAAPITYPRLLTDHCNKSLVDVAQYLSGSFYAGDVVVAANANWNNWALDFKVSSIAGIDSSVADTARVAAELTRDKIIASFNTRNITTKLSNGSSISFDAQIAFAGDLMHIALVPSPGAVALPVAYVSDGQMLGDENFDLRLPISVFNKVSATQIGTAPFPLNPQVFGAFTISTPMMALNGATLQTKLAFSCPNCSIEDFTISWVGDDLAVNDASLVLRQTCAPRDFLCVGFSRAMPAIAGIFLQNLKGQLLRPTDFTHGADVTAFGTPLHVSIQGLKSSIVGQEIQFQNLMSVAVDHVH